MNYLLVLWLPLLLIWFVISIWGIGRDKKDMLLTQFHKKKVSNVTESNPAEEEDVFI